MGRSKYKTVKSSKRSGPREIDPADAKVGKINTWEDVADEEDEFHISRDKIPLSLDDYKLPKAHLGADDDEPSDEEVLDLEQLPSSDDDDEDEEDDGYDGDVLGERRQGIGMYSDDEESDDQDGEGKDEYGRWGAGRKDYYDANVIENEEDQRLEEEEAADIIRHQYDGFNNEDFFFDDEDMEIAMGNKDAIMALKKKVGWKNGGEGADAADSMAMDALRVALPEGAEERKKLLYTVHPEFEALAKEFTALVPLLEEYKVEVSDGDGFRTSIRHAKFIALSAHLGVLSMYFALMAEGRPAGEMVNLRDHKVMETIKKTRTTWEAVREMEEEEADDDSDDGEEVWQDMEDEEEEAEPLQIEAAKPLTNGKSSLFNGLAAVEKLMAKNTASKNKKRKRVSDDVEPLARRKSSKSSKQTEGNLPDIEEDLADLADLLKQPPKRLKSALKKPKDTKVSGDNDFTEDAHLHADDAEEKAKRKKSLRFYTSQIVQRADKRGRAGRDAGGDMDIPHKERERERRDRLNAEAKKRGMASALGVDLDDAEMNEDDLRVGKEVRGETDDEDNSDAEYYDMVASKAKKAKELKKMLYDAEKAGSKVVETEEIDPETGKRAIGYTIQKNKGLTPHRKKDVRNPRVKKRKKYEQAKKKLSSTRAVYKPPTSAYGGEQTGIKTKLVKSIKFK